MNRFTIRLLDALFFLVVAALMLFASAAAQAQLSDIDIGTPPTLPVMVITGQRDPTPFETMAPASLRIDDPVYGPRIAIVGDGTIQFGHGATIDFADFAPENLVPVGRVRFVLVRVGGEFYLMPVWRAKMVVPR
jgi:hypothetical protein